MVKPFEGGLALGVAAPLPGHEMGGVGDLEEGLVGGAHLVMEGEVGLELVVIFSHHARRCRKKWQQVPGQTVEGIKIFQQSLPEAGQIIGPLVVGHPGLSDTQG